MISFAEKANCCGCSACIQICPVKCITMRSDEDGFLYPLVNLSLCVNCTLCEQVCPILNPYESKKPIRVIAAKNASDSVRLNSSSGGIFYLLAEQTIKKGGIVFGACFDDDWNVAHMYTETLEGLQSMMGSKYVQSYIGDSYKIVEKYLKQGRYVLFSGTPCQVSGLSRFLRNGYDKLLTVDVVCHGVPSPLVWQRYIDSIGRDNIGSINFRAKQFDGYTWNGYGFVIKNRRRETIISQKSTRNPFLKGYSNELYTRPSCYSCSFKKCRSNSSITIGDFWKVWDYHKAFFDNKGASIVLVNDCKGLKVIESLNVVSLNISYDEAVECNPMLINSAICSSARAEFWERYRNEGMSCIDSVVAKFKPSLCKRVLRKLSSIFHL